MTDKTRQQKWDEQNAVKKTFKFMKVADADILAHLEKQPNKAAYIRELIRRDMNK